MQDLDGWGFGCLLSQKVVHVVTRMGKTRGQHNKRNLVARET
jgi:hypothetical protein